MSKIKMTGIQSQKIWINETKDSGTDSPLAAHLNWNQRINKENKDRLKSTYDLYTNENDFNVLNSSRAKRSDGFRVEGKINVSSSKNLATEHIIGLPKQQLHATRDVNINSYELIPARDKVINNMYSTAGSPSPEKKNRWLSTPPGKERQRHEELGAIFTFNSPLSPIRPYPTPLKGINQQLMSSRRIFPLDAESPRHGFKHNYNSTMCVPEKKLHATQYNQHPTNEGIKQKRSSI